MERKFWNDIEQVFIEFKLSKKKRPLCCSYNPHKNFISNHVDILKRAFNFHFSNYNNLLLLGSFKSKMTDLSLKDFCQLYWLKNLIKKPTCFKNTDSPKTFDVVLTNRLKSFCSFNSIENGLSDFHKFNSTVLETIAKRYKISQLQKVVK